MAVTVRPGTADDRQVLAHLCAHMDAEQNVSSDPPREFASSFDDWLSRHGDTWYSFIAEEDERPIGMVWLADVPRMPGPSDLSPAPLGCVTAFFVEPRYRNEGVGAALLAAMSAAVDQLPYDTVIAWPGERSASAYRRAGFRPPEELLERPSSAIDD